MSKHIKRLTVPRSWSIPRKTHTFAPKVSSGPHGRDSSVPLLVAVRDMLKLCDTGREARRIIGERKIAVDGRVVTDPKHPLGFMDTLSIKEMNEDYRLLLNLKGKFILNKIPSAEAKWKFVRIEKKTTVRGGEAQLNLHDGRNILLDDDAYRTGDVLKIELPSQKILDYYPMEKGSIAMVIGGKHVGQISEIVGYEVTRNPKPNLVSLRDGYSTIKDYVFVIGKGAPEIKIPEVSAL